MKFFNDLTLLQICIWDNEVGESSEGDVGDEGQDDSDDSGASSSHQRTFTQKEVDEIVVKRNKKVKAQLENMEKSYENLLKQQNLNQETREQLEQDLENVRAQMRTKEQQLEHEKKQTQKKYQAELEEARKQAEFYKSQFESSTVQRAIMDAASGEAYDVDQFVTLLKDKTQLVDELDDDGEKTGRKVPRVQWEIDVEDDDGRSRKQSIVLSPEQVVQKMKEQKKYQNLFKSNVAGGLGASNAPIGKGGRPDIKSMTVEQYAEFRKTPEGRRALGLNK